VAVKGLPGLFLDSPAFTRDEGRTVAGT
jgi:hypothetical protein